MTKVLVCLVVVLLVANLYLFFNCGSKKEEVNGGYHFIERNGMEQQQQPMLQENNMNNMVNNLPMVKLYFSPGCGHCVRLKERAWPEFVSKMNGKVLIKEINCSQESCDGVRGVPHIVLSNNGRELVYNGNRSADDLIMWVNSNL